MTTAWAASPDGLTVWSPGYDHTVALLLAPLRALVICGQLTPIELSWDDHATTVAPSRGHDDWAVGPLRADSMELNGMVAFLNAEAHALFPRGESPLGRDAADALTPELARIWRAGNGKQVAIELLGRRFDVVCRVLGSATNRRGRLMVLTPQTSATLVP